jgi:L,D-transpeptidase-like protein/putative peptidoglycan binding protein
VRKVLIVIGVLLFLLAGATAAAAWRYDEARHDRLAEGIVLAGVDVSGMRVREARTSLERQVAGPLVKPILIRFKAGQFVFSPADAEVSTNLEALVRQALDASRKGNFLTRAFRDVTGGRLGSHLSLDVSYSDAAVEEFVKTVERTVDRRPRDARSRASFAGVRIWPSRRGARVNSEELASRIEDLLVDPTASRSFDLPVRILRPKVTTGKLRKRFLTFLAVSRSQKELRLFVKEKLVKTYSVAIGRIGFETPPGLYEIRTKAINPAWFVPNKPWAGDLAGKIIPPNDPENPLKARWMGFWDGAGIHGTADSSSIGFAASHGCIRMRVPDVVQLYDRVPLHTPLYIS